MRYHCPVYFVLNFHKNFTPAYHRHIWLFHRGDYHSFSQDIEATDWDALKDNNIDTYAKNITGQISNLAHKHIPNKTITVRQSDPPWLTNEIKKMIRKRKRLYNKFKRTKNNIDFESYKQIMNKIICEIRKSKQQQINQLADKHWTKRLVENTQTIHKTRKLFLNPATLPQ